MKLKTATLYAISTLAILSACKKDESKTEESQTAASVVGTWKLTAALLNGTQNGKDTTLDLIAEGWIKPCELDDLVRYNSDHTITRMEGATKCDSTSADSQTSGTWTLINNNTLQVINGDTNVMEILTLSSTTLKVKGISSTSGSGSPTYFIETLTRQ